MINLVKQPCIDYTAALLSTIEELSPSTEYGSRVWVRHGPQGLVFTETQGSKKCVVFIWGAVSVDVVYVTDGVKGEDIKTTTGQVAETAQSIIDFFSDTI